jgi:hypothetical protein
MIPFVFVIVVIITTNYVVFSIDMLRVPFILQPLIILVGVSGFIATAINAGKEAI